MKNKIILSIIVPIYNSEMYLKECLNSILKCKSKNIEIILIDDGSTDNSSNICNNYSKSDNRIKLIHQKNSGVSKARNNGINISRGDYLMFMDSDDILDDNWEFILSKIKDDDIYYFSERLNKNIEKSDILRYIIGYNKENFCFAGPFSKVFKKKLLLDKKIIFNINLINGEDMLFNVNALLQCKNYKIIDKSFYNYRNFQGSSTKKFNEKIVKSDIIFHTELNYLLNKFNIDKILKNEICLYNLQTAIIVILFRISYIKLYKETKKYYKLLSQPPYTFGLNNKCILNKKQSIILFLFKIKQYRLIYNTFNILKFIKFKKNNSFYFSKI